MTARRVLRAAILAGLATVVLSRTVFTTADLVRVKVAESARHARDGSVNVTTDAFPQVERLRPPFALIARLNHLPPGTSQVSIAVDDTVACAPRVDGGNSRRVDCAVAAWRPGTTHDVTIQGPSTDWTLDYLELATHHGNTSGAHYLVIFPRSSDRYARPAPALVGTFWLLLTAVLLLPAPPLPRGWIRMVHRGIAAAVVIASAASLVSPWLTNYRIVLAARTFVLWLALLLVPRLWPLGIRLPRVRLRASLLAAGTAVAVVIVGILSGTFEVAGADGYGYVSQAHLWATGTLRVEQPFVRDMPWPFAAESFVPLGYRLAPQGTSIIPMYSPGYPMIMALFERLAGREAVFCVVPLLGGLAVWATYLLGCGLGRPWIGVAAAMLLAVSPSFVFQLQNPMSDVPVTAWWALCLACVVSDRRLIVLAAGLAAGAAILTRPNLAPLAAIPAALLLWPVRRERALTGPSSKRLLVFFAGLVPACAVVAIVNARLWGSPFVSGYGSFDAQFAWQNLAPNLARYPRWMFETQTPSVLLAPLALFVLKPFRSGVGPTFRSGWLEGDRSPGPRAIATLWLAFAAGVFLSYLFYTPFDGWVWLRFVLPAFPMLLVLMMVALAGVLARASYAAVAIALVVGLVAWHEWSFASNLGLFHVRDARPPNAAIGDYIEKNLPDRALFLSRYQSGSLRYYSGRLTMRWDVVPPEMLDAVLEDLRQRGYRPYIVLEEAEEPPFRERFHGHSALAELDWPPLATHGSSKVRIYDPADKSAPAQLQRTSVVIQ